MVRVPTEGRDVDIQIGRRTRTIRKTHHVEDMDRHVQSKLRYIKAGQAATSYCILFLRGICNRLGPIMETDRNNALRIKTEPFSNRKVSTQSALEITPELIVTLFSKVSR